MAALLTGPIYSLVFRTWEPESRTRFRLASHPTGGRLFAGPCDLLKADSSFRLIDSSYLPHPDAERVVSRSCSVARMLRLKRTLTTEG